jgi:hypothetical protein
MVYRLLTVTKRTFFATMPVPFSEVILSKNHFVKQKPHENLDFQWYF